MAAGPIVEPTSFTNTGLIDTVIPIGAPIDGHEQIVTVLGSIADTLIEAE